MFWKTFWASIAKDGMLTLFVRKQQIRNFLGSIHYEKSAYFFSVSKSQIRNFWMDNLQIANPQIS